MKKFFLYLSKHYLKNFLIITFALTFTTVLIDFLQHINKIEGFNRKILYSFFRFEEYLAFVYPLAIIFAAVATLYNFVEKNYLIVLESLSYTRKRLLKPFIVVSFIIYLIFLALHFTDFAYANNNAEEIKAKSNMHTLENLFFKYNNSFVFAKKLDMINKKFKDVTLYTIKGQKVDTILHFKEAYFKDKKWIAKDIEEKKLHYKNGVPTGYDSKKIKELEILKGYYPKVIKLLYEGKRMRIDDGIRAYILSKKQNIDTTKIVSSLLSKIIMPLYAIFLIVIIFYYTPISKRFFNKGKYLFYSIGSALLLWTLLYSLNMLSLAGTINPWLGQPLVIGVLALYAMYCYVRLD